MPFSSGATKNKNLRDVLGMKRGETVSTFSKRISGVGTARWEVEKMTKEDLQGSRVCEMSHGIKEREWQLKRTVKVCKLKII